MEWQSMTTFVILAVAAGILLGRLGSFFRSGKAGGCGSCAGCGNSTKDEILSPLVQLKTTHDIVRKH